MGWLFMRDMGGHAAPRAYLDNQFTYPRDDHRLTVLASSMVGVDLLRRVRTPRERASDRQVFAVVCLTKHNPCCGRRPRLWIQRHDRTYGALRERLPRLRSSTS